MKKSLLLFLVLFTGLLNTSLNAQLEFPEDKVSWDFGVIQDGEDVTIVGTITMVENWHIYGAHLPAGSFALPSTVTLMKSSSFETIGDVTEPKPHFEHDELADEDLFYHSNTIVLKQRIKVLSEKDFIVKGVFGFQTCDDTHCLPPHEAEFSVEIKGLKVEELIEPVITDEMTDDTVLLISVDSVPLISNDTVTVNSIKKDGAQNLKIEQIIPSLANLDLAKPIGDCGEKKSISNVWMVFLFGFIGGLIALLTPCVFPMIPLTVSFFTKGDSGSSGVGKAVLYGFFIFLIYALLSVPFHFNADPAVLSEVATSVWLNILFFIVFIVFAISFFGYFEISLPSKFSNKADSASNVGGVLGVFFMALTLALVSFSCTGPILGTVLGSALKNGPWPITAAMSGFGIALGLPFAVFA
ncbi:MAG: protein-disulfide reductase, partial [Flavobacteriales bacterium]|nr:protein-disulfide reductase [Flavobacteriales bacterium]